LLDFVVRDIKLFQIFDKNYTVRQFIDIIVTYVQILKIVQACKIIIVDFLKLVITDIYVNDALAKEKVRKFRDMIMIQIYLFKAYHLGINILEKLVRNDLITAQVNTFQIIKVSELFSNTSYIIKTHK